jgi:class 3 adenylate cyclase
MDDSFFDYWDFRSECFSVHKKIVSALRPAEPFERSLCYVFHSLLDKLGYFLGFNAGCHIFVNPDRFIGPFNNGLFHLMRRKTFRYEEVPFNHKQVITGISELDSSFWPKAERYFTVLPLISEVEPTTANEGFLPKSVNGGVTLVRLSTVDHAEPYNLGFCLLWNDPSEAPIRGPHVDQEHLEAWIREVQALLLSHLQSVFDMQPRTYLPAYRIIGRKRVGILFGDIRNFSTITEILRNKGQFSVLTNFLNHFCGEMARVIGKYGRLDKFIGDGIMAVVGEYCADSREMCGRALLSAKEMCEAFESNKETWFADKDATMLRFMQENNENVDLQLGIGLNVGEVHFDYYGAPGKQEYTAISDHVNFAQRLESLASQVTEAESGRRREPIAISQAFFHQLSGHVDGKEVSFLTAAFLADEERCRPTFLNMKGLGLRYPVYFLRCNDINEDGIRRYLEGRP